MKVTVNGQEESIEPCTVEAFVTAKGLPSDSLVVELNREIIKQPQWSGVQLQEGDSLELLSFVGGG